jgi:hypothetical protein
MLINQDGQLTTHGPSRTEIRQQPKDDQEGGKADGKGETKPDGKSKGEHKGKGKPEKASPAQKK